MLSTVTWTAPSTCLRCQLRQVIFGPPTQPRSRCFNQPKQKPSRCFAASTRRYQESEEDRIFDDEGNGNAQSKLSKYPLGRVIGKPGRRQRQSSARLKSNAMKKPFDVIVMRDFTEPMDKTIELGKGLSLERDRTTENTGTRIASEILDAAEEPSQEEVEESIDSLRPAMTILDDRHYNELAKRLLDGYNAQQLSLYLIKALKLSAIDADEIHIVRKESTRSKQGMRSTPWKPGRTPLGQRHNQAGILKKSELGTNKTKLAQQILRLAWNLITHSEMQSIGEMEMPLESWQITYLFDLILAGVPMHEAMIGSPLLRRSSEVRPFRPDNVMRITARRQDAEEIMEQIEQKLRDVKGLELDLTVFKKKLGQPGWPRKLMHLFDEPILKDVERRTATVVEQRDFKTLVVHGSSETSLQHASRVLLSTLNLPSPRRIDTIVVGTAFTDAQESFRSPQPLLLPDYAGSSLPFRYRNLKLGRLTTPSRLTAKLWNLDDTTETGREGELGPDDFRETNTVHLTHAQDLAQHLSHMGPYYPFHGSTTTDRSSYWTMRESLPPQTWDVQFCKILHPAVGAIDVANPMEDVFRKRKDDVPSIKFSPHESKQSIVQPQIPGIDGLLSNFAPKYAEPKPLTLVAHFMPSPLARSGVTAMSTLPRIEILYGFSRPGLPAELERDHGLHILGMRSILAEQELRVPLPQETVDLRFHRSTLSLARKSRALDDPEIKKFTQTLERSAIRGDGALEGEPMVKFRLPAWLFESQTILKRSEKPRKDIEVEYLFEKFEQVQSTDFVPRRVDRAVDSIDRKMQKLLKGMPKNSLLRYKEVESGIVGGRRTELWLTYEPLSKLVSPRTSDTQEGEAGFRSGDEGQLEGGMVFNIDEHGNTSELKREMEMQRDQRLVETSLRLANALTNLSV